MTHEPLYVRDPLHMQDHVLRNVVRGHSNTTPPPLILIEYDGFHRVERRRGMACHPIPLMLNILSYI
jgi:hypothetical protein